ncbi:MAG: putative heat shock protein [Proteobacteria bacterium]|jgi:HSP20 family molecular chaperone IbpA|nr:putative heat shock protein [Pseudomonadota bacterium]MCU0806487.1 Hsp20/alpha crystallin family protein [Candidatus Contendobacter sp.]
MSDNTAATRATQAARPEALLLPPVDVIENGTGIILYADLPGVSKDTLNVHVEADTLTIEGRLSLAVPEGLEVSHAEVSLPGYRRTFTLSRELDTTKVSAEFKQGLLTLRIPKAESAQPRKIAVSVA